MQMNTIILFLSKQILFNSIIREQEMLSRNRRIQNKNSNPVSISRDSAPFIQGGHENQSPPTG